MNAEEGTRSAQLRNVIHFCEDDERIDPETGLRNELFFEDKLPPKKVGEGEAPLKDFEHKTYLLLIVYNDRDLGKSWELCNGRTEAYNYIKDNIEDIDIHESTILTETRQIDAKTKNHKYFMTSIDEVISVFEFCRHVSGSYNDGFDIYEYDYSNEYQDTSSSEYSMVDPEAQRIFNAIRDDITIGNTSSSDSDEV